MKKSRRNEVQPDPVRRALIRAIFGIPALSLVGCADGASEALASRTAPTALSPTPACGDDDDDPTPSQTEGPYFKPRSPERSSLIESSQPGTRLILTGQVLSTGCAPIARALLDFWQADDGGAYDLAGFQLRGHQFTDGSGRFTLTTIVPGLYPGRTRHIHVKVQAPSQAVLTTQLYFPGEPRNATDGIYSPELLMNVTDNGTERQATFNFVLQL